MPNVDDAFPSKYLKADDLPEDGSEAFEIEDVKLEKVGKGDQKLLVSFVGQEKGLILNKTNAGIITKLTGSKDTDDWIGTTIHLYRAEVEYPTGSGTMVDSIRVRSKAPKNAKPAAKKAAPEPETTTEEEDEVPF